MKKDISFKELLKEIAKDISLYLLNIKIEEDIQLIDKEFTRIEKREADLVFIHKNQIIHIEIQNNNDKNMHLRMLRYLSDIAFSYSEYEIIQYVIYIGKEKCSIKDRYINKNINFRYNLIDMKKIDCSYFLNSNKPEMIVLAILCDFQDRDKQKVVNEILIKLKALSKNDNLFKKNVEILNVLSTNRDLEEELKKGVEMLRDIDLTKTPLYKLGIERGYYQGVDEGINIGINQGEQKAKKEMLKLMIDMGIDKEKIAKKLNITIFDLENLLKG